MTLPVLCSHPTCRILFTVATMHWLQFQLLIWNILGADQHPSHFPHTAVAGIFSTYDLSDNWMQGKLLISIDPQVSANYHGPAIAWLFTHQCNYMFNSMGRPYVICQESVWIGPVLTNVPSKSMWYFAGGFGLCRANYIIHNDKVITHPHCVGWPDRMLYFIYFSKATKTLPS